jgi:hypothetical protein
MKSFITKSDSSQPVGETAVYLFCICFMHAGYRILLRPCERQEEERLPVSVVSDRITIPPMHFTLYARARFVEISLTSLTMFCESCDSTTDHTDRYPFGARPPPPSLPRCSIAASCAPSDRSVLA